MTSCADQSPGLGSHGKNAHVHARKYGMTGQIRPDCHKLKYFLLLAQMLAVILSPTGTTSGQHLAPQLILYCNYRQSRINSALSTLARRNQFFTINKRKVQLINNNNQRDVRLILYCNYPQDAIN
jgi:hypothetical protein